MLDEVEAGADVRTLAAGLVAWRDRRELRSRMEWLRHVEDVARLETRLAAAG